MNCKPGDLAIIVALDSTPTNNLGALVEVIGAIGDVYGVDGFHWRVRSIGSPLAIMCFDTGQIERSMDCAEADKCLRPIRPGEHKLTEIARELALT